MDCGDIDVSGGDVPLTLWWAHHGHGVGPRAAGEMVTSCLVKQSFKKEGRGRNTALCWLKAPA